MYLTIKQEPRLSKDESSSLKELCHTAKNLYNEALYSIRQHFFNTGKYLNYYENYKVLKNSDNYKLLNSNMAQQILKEADGSFKSFFSLLKLVKQGKYNREDVRIPKYLDKDGYTTLVIGFVRLNGNKLLMPYSNSFKKEHKPIEVTIPPQLTDKKIKEIRITPRLNASYFEFQYTYEADIERISNLSSHKYLSLDIGINNLVSAITNDGQSFLIDGRHIKSINQWFNKENARLQSIHYKQLHIKGNISKDKIPYTRKQLLLLDKRNKRINDYMSKTSRYIINYYINNNIGNIIIGYNKDIQRSSNIGKANNQSFTSIPIGRLKGKLTYLCELYGINLILQEESYTSKASFLDHDEIPVYERGSINYTNSSNNDNIIVNDGDTSYVFLGSRIKRGLYKTSKGKLINADINGALNIMKKALTTSKADDLRLLSNLCIAGHVDVLRKNKAGLRLNI